MGIFKTGWLRADGDDETTRRFSWAHVKTVFYNKASNILLKDKLDEMDASIAQNTSNISTNTGNISTINNKISNKTIVAGSISMPDTRSINDPRNIYEKEIRGICRV